MYNLKVVMAQQLSLIFFELSSSRVGMTCMFTIEEQSMCYMTAVCQTNFESQSTLTCLYVGLKTQGVAWQFMFCVDYLET